MGGLWLEFPKFNHSIGRRILELASAIGGLRVGGLKDSLVSFFQVDFFCVGIHVEFVLGGRRVVDN